MQKPGEEGPRRSFESILSHSAPAYRTAVLATLFPSCVYFTTLWLPRVGGPDYRSLARRGAAKNVH